MEKIHRYIKRCLKGTSADVKLIKIRKGMLRRGLLGLAEFESKTLYLDYNRDNRNEFFYLTLFHEIAHFFFKDYLDNREPEESNINEENDVTELRAEKSAKHILKWYFNNPDKLKELNEIIYKIPTKKLTKLEKEDI